MSTFAGCSHISDAEVDQDILDTKREIVNYTDEMKILERNLSENKVRIHTLRERIAKREIFITQLLELLNWRKENCRMIKKQEVSGSSKEVIEAARALFDNRLDWSNGRNSYAPRKYWKDLNTALYGKDDPRTKEFRVSDFKITENDLMKAFKMGMDYSNELTKLGV